MYDVCLKVEGNSAIKKALCKNNADSFYQIVRNFAQAAYNSSQKKHCDCVSSINPSNKFYFDLYFQFVYLLFESMIKLNKEAEAKQQVMLEL